MVITHCKPSIPILMVSFHRAMCPQIGAFHFDCASGVAKKLSLKLLWGKIHCKLSWLALMVNSHVVSSHGKLSCGKVSLVRLYLYNGKFSQ